MTSYKGLRKQEITDTGFTTGAVKTQQTFQNVAQNDTVLVSHTNDTTSSRRVQVIEFKPESETTTNTSLDFDTDNESDFVQEDAVSGTKFGNGQISLQPTWGSDGAFNEQQKIMSSDIEAGDNFGYRVGIHGDTAVVGAWCEDTGGTNAGAAYIFTRSGSTWVEQQKITASDTQAEDRFGCAVDIYEDTVVVGAWGEDTGGSATGAAYIFVRSGSTWTEQQKIQVDDTQNEDYFGTSVSVYDDTAVVGANGNAITSFAGSAYIFTRSGTTWTWQQKITASDTQAGDLFGTSVSLYEDTIAVGAHSEDTDENATGAAYIFTLSGTTWVEQQKIQASDKGENDQFGISVVVYDDTLIAGSYGEETVSSNSGAAYIFTLSGTTWVEQQKITASDAQPNDLFGYSVSVYGDTAVVGAYGEDVGGDPWLSQTGAIYTFTRSGSIWTEQQKIRSSDRESDDLFGWSVDIYENTIIASSYTENTGGTDAGAAYIFSKATFPLTTKYVTTSDTNQILLTDVSEINSCTVTNTIASGTSIKCLASFDGRSTWDKWSGSAWNTHTGGLTNLQTGNTVTELQTGFTNLTIASGVDYLDLAFDMLTTNSGHSPSIDAISVNYDEDGLYRLYDMGSNYEVNHYATDQTGVTKNSAGIKNIKINVTV